VRIPFSSSPRSSLGVEWELELVDLETRELTSGASGILAELTAAHAQVNPDANPEDEHPKAKHELLESTIEIITDVCSTVSEAKADLWATLEEVSAAAGRRGLGVMCSGTHPITDWATQEISPSPRYARLVDQMQWLARQLQIFGVHVHVGVRAPEKAIPIVNALTYYVPHFLALSASSPFWMGADTGLASARSKVFEQLPTAGLPYQLSGWEQFEELMETLIASRAVQSVREVWWDIRPHPGFGTVELRICDGLPTLREVGAIAALSQCLVDRHPARPRLLAAEADLVAGPGEQVAGGPVRPRRPDPRRRLRCDASVAGCRPRADRRPESAGRPARLLGGTGRRRPHPLHRCQLPAAA
jgi:YbdK family carboxylate-amine ligase